jgi:hypothetical protein
MSDIQPRPKRGKVTRRKTGNSEAGGSFDRFMDLSDDNDVKAHRFE